jgi:hypothetical protein
MVFYAPVNLCDRRVCSASVAVGISVNVELYASYGMESNRKADRRRDKLPSGEGGGCEEIKAIAM